MLQLSQLKTDKHDTKKSHLILLVFVIRRLFTLDTKIKFSP